MCDMHVEDQRSFESAENMTGLPNEMARTLLVQIDRAKYPPSSEMVSL